MVECIYAFACKCFKVDVHVKCKATGDVMLRISSEALQVNILLSGIVYGSRRADLQRSPNFVSMLDNLIESTD